MYIGNLYTNMCFIQVQYNRAVVVYSIQQYVIIQRFATGQWFSPGILVSSSDKTHDILVPEILLKVALNNINHQPPNPTCTIAYQWHY